MGGVFSGRTLISGSVGAPGLPLASSPLSGLYSQGNGAGFAFNALNYYTLNAMGFSYGNKPDTGFNIVPASFSPKSVTPGFVSSSFVMSPDGRFAFIHPNTNQIRVFKVDVATGNLSEIVGSPFVAVAANSMLAVSPDGKHLYAWSGGFNQIIGYVINQSTGALALAGGSPYGLATAHSNFGVDISPDGKYLIAANAANHSVEVYSRNSTTGNLTAVVGSPFFVDVLPGISGPTGIAVSPDNAHVYVTNWNSNNVGVYTLNTLTGALNAIAGIPFACGANPAMAVVTPDGLHVITANQNSGDLSVFSRNPTTGVIAQIASSPVATIALPGVVTVSPDNLHVFVGGTNSVTLPVFSRAPTTGILTPIAGSPFAGVSHPSNVVISPDGAFVFADSGNTANLSIFNTQAVQTFNLINATFDPVGGTGGTFGINGQLLVNGSPVLSPPVAVSDAGKFLRANNSGTGVVFDGVNTDIPVAMVANAATVTFDDSGNYILDITGVLTGQGTLTIALTVPANAMQLLIDNSITGAFTLVTAGAAGVVTIPKGKSQWYWNGTVLEYVSGGGFDTPNVTPMPAAGVVVAVNHYMGITPSWVNLELICLTAEKGYAVNDVINAVAQATAGLVLSPLSFFKDSTIVGFTLIAGNQIAIMNATTGAYELPTGASWAYRFGVDR
jgi:6-phosphogluconolactonase (cycloisomerase 2 family)